MLILDLPQFNLPFNPDKLYQFRLENPKIKLIVENDVPESVEEISSPQNHEDFAKLLRQVQSNYYLECRWLL